MNQDKTSGAEMVDWDEFDKPTRVLFGPHEVREGTVLKWDGYGTLKITEITERGVPMVPTAKLTRHGSNILPSEAVPTHAPIERGERQSLWDALDNGEAEIVGVEG